MSDDKLKLPKTPCSVPNFPEFTHISRFSNANSSFYQALSIGLLEIIIRFNRLPEKGNSFKESLLKQIKFTLSFCESKGFSIKSLNLFQNLISILSSQAETIEHAFAWLKAYSERPDIVNESLDLAMRQILCSRFSDSNIQVLILMDSMLNISDVLLGAFCNFMNICVCLYEAGKRILFFNQEHNEYFVLPILKEKNEFSLLYTKVMNDSESNYGFVADLLRGPGFIIKRTEIIELRQSNNLRKEESKSPEEYKSPTRKKMNLNFKNFFQRPASPFKNSKNLAQLKGVIISEENNSFSSSRLDSQDRCRQRVPSVRKRSSSLIQIKCLKCSMMKLITDINLIKCHPDAGCRICLSCRKTNKEQCPNCQRYYSPTEISKLNSV